MDTLSCEMQRAFGRYNEIVDCQIGIEDLEILDTLSDGAFMFLLDEKSRSHVKSLLFQRTLIGVVAVHADKIQFCQDFLSVIEHA